MTQRFSKSVFAASLFAATVTVAFAQQKLEPIDLSSSSTEQIHARMLDIAGQIEQLRNSFGRQAYIDRLAREYQALSDMLGGDDPASWGRASSGVQAAQPNTSGTQFIANPTCSGAVTTSNHPGTTGVISVGAANPVTFTAAVAGAGTYLWDINVNTTITHTECADLDMTLTSPSGTVVTLTTDNGGANDNVFNGTVWDDNINDTTMDHIYANNVVANPLNAEGRLGNFRGEDPNAGTGIWTLTITDDLATDIGTVTAFSLDITTATPPATTTNTYTDSPALAIGPGPSLHSDTQVVALAGTILTDLEVYVEITHTFSADLDISLLPPIGPAIKLSTDNGGGNDNNFNGTTFDQDSANVATDFAYVNLIPVPNLQPEGSFDNWLGIDPNGVWTINVDDDLGGDFGVLARWDLIVTTETAPIIVAGPVNYPGTTGAIPDAGSGGPSGPLAFTTTVSGIGTYLWDVDLNAVINHTLGADLDMTLTSAAGTTVVVSTDNGLSQAFNGTLFDDNANAPVTDAVYVSGSASTPLSPEGRFSAFRGEDPNAGTGVWTLTISDDLASNGGSLTSWSLDLSTLPSAPVLNSNTFSSSPNLAIVDVATVSDVIAVSAIGTSIAEVVLYTEITHTFAADLDVTLTLGSTTVAVSTDNGGGNDNVFNGTTFDPDVLDTVTDHIYANLTVATPLSPEGSFDNFNGLDPNANWTLTITDDLGGDVGVLVRWDLTIATCAPQVTVLDCQILPTVTQTCDSVASATGTASATAGSGFTTTFSIMNAQVNGVVFYGINGPSAGPWSAQSLLCIKAPTVRLGGVAGASGLTGGTIGNCDGQYSFDANAVILAAGIPQNTTMIVQGWQRDPASMKTTNLTDALSFLVGP